MKRALPLIASAALVVALATGCGGGSDDSSGGGGRPSVDDIASGLQDAMGDQLGGNVTDAMTTCIAQAFHDSDLSDDALQAIADGDKDYQASSADQKALSSVSTGSVAACATAAPSPSDSPSS